MQKYIFRRLLLVFPTLIGVTLVVFGMVRLLPGDAVSLMLQDYSAYSYAKDAADLRTKLGLDRPFLEQYATWVGIWPTEDGFSGLLQGGGTHFRTARDWKPDAGGRSHAQSSALGEPIHEPTHLENLRAGVAGYSMRVPSHEFRGLLDDIARCDAF